MTDQRLLAAWGLTVTAGWLVTAWFGAAGTALFGLGVAGTIIAAWAVLMAAPLAMTFAGRRADLHSGAWAALVALGLAENAYVARAGGGHDHSAHGHGSGSGEGESAQAGHHGAEPDSSGGTSEPAHAEADAGGHPHPDGGHADGTGSSSEASDAPATSSGSNPTEHADGEHSHPDGGHSDDAHSDSTGHAGGNERTGAASEAGQAGGGHHAGGDGGTAGGGEAEASIVTPEVQHVSYYHLWFAVGAVGFAVSAVQAEGGGRKTLYGAASALNALMVVLLIVYPPVEAAAFLIAAAIQGLPMLADLPLRARLHRAAAE